MTRRYTLRRPLRFVTLKLTPGEHRLLIHAVGRHEGGLSIEEDVLLKKLRRARVARWGRP